MADYDFDLFVIGAGSGGVRCGRVSASLGARVAVAEERELGGTCVNVGCIPKKLLHYASHYAEHFEDAEAYGWTLGPRSFDWATLIANKNKEISRLNGIYGRLLEEAGVTLLTGHARLLDPHCVEVSGQRYSAANILVATGSWPHVPKLEGAEHAITSNEFFHLKALPERALVVGGGYIAVELAGILHGMGCDVTQLYRGPLFLRGFDPDVRQVLAEEMKKKGVDLRFEANIARIEKSASGLRAVLDDGATLECDTILYATGRLPLTSGIGLEEAGVKLGAKGEVLVDEFSRSSVENIWAIGDATDRMNLTPVAIHEAMCLAKTLFGGEPTSPVHENVASAVFSQPPVASVGLGEDEARDRFGTVDVYRTRFGPLLHTLTGRSEQTMMKLLVDSDTDRVVGCHMVGPEAGEIIQGLAVAVKCGATKAQFDATVGVHPTSAEEFVTMREKVD
jgi:glutathione reductase (NADPH)